MASNSALTGAVGWDWVTCRMIVEKHGGGIDVESGLGKGSRFRVWLPMDVRPADKMNMNALSESQEKLALNTRILLVDDDPGIRKDLQVALSEFGYEPSEAEDGTKAVDMLQRAFHGSKPDALAILDAVMPGAIIGLDTLRAIRDAHPKAKVVLCGGQVNPDWMRRWSALGFDGVIAKPCSLKDIEQMVESLTGVSSGGSRKAGREMD